MSATLRSVPAWDAGARSVAVLERDGAFSFRVGQATGIVCGLAAQDTDAGWRGITHGFFIQGSHYQIIESGVTRTALAPLDPDPGFLIARVAGRVVYWINGWEVYASAAPSAGPVFLDSSLYAYGDEIFDLSFAEYDEASGAASLPALWSFGADDADLALSRAPLRPLAASAVATDPAGGDTRLPSLVARGAEAEEIAFGRAALRPLRALGEDTVPIPEQAWGTAFLAPLAAGGLIGDETLSAARGLARLAPLAALGAEDAAACFGRAILSPLDAFAIPAPSFYLWGELPQWELRPAWRGIAALTVPAPILVAEGSSEPSTMIATVPLPSLVARGGGRAVAEVPAPLLVASGVLQGVLRAEIEVPAPTLTAVVVAEGRAFAMLEMPAPSLVAFGGGRAALTVPPPLLVASGVLQGVLRAAMEVPAPLLVAEGSAERLARAVLLVPAPLAGAALGARVELTLDPPRLVARGSAAGVAEATDTMAVNLDTGAITAWALPAFQKLVTAHGALYGLKPDGTLHRFDGARDGAIPIPVTLRFGANLFGTTRVKSMSDLYFSTREDDGLTVEVVADERESWRYRTQPDRQRGYGAHKVQVGKGIAFHTAGLIVRNRAGGELDLGAVEAVVNVKSRRPK